MVLVVVRDKTKKMIPLVPLAPCLLFAIAVLIRISYYTIVF